MKRKEFIKYAIVHSDRASLESVLFTLVEKIPMIEEQLFKLYSDEGAGFIKKANGKLVLKKFNRKE